MTYDFSGPWTPHAGHHAQLYTPRTPHSDAAALSCDSAVAYLLRQGVPGRKILLGVPAYGRSFRGASGPGDGYDGCAGEEGTFEYRDLPRPGAEVRFDERVGAVCCVGGDAGFVSYDDVRCVRAKAGFARAKGLGGMFYW